MLKLDYRSRDLCRQRFYNEDFSNQDLSKLKLRGSLFHRCWGPPANMTEADCEGSDFLGSSFDDTNCYRTNFRDAKLAGTIFKPKDCFGMTITLQCRTFKDMRISKMWWLVWLMFASMMKPGTSIREEEELQNNLITAVGSEQYIRLRTLLAKREL